MSAVLLTPAEPPPDWPSLGSAATGHAPVPMAAVEGPTHLLRYANPAFCRLLGQPVEQLLGQPFHQLLPEREECLTLLDRVFRTGKSAGHSGPSPSESPRVFWSYTVWPVMAAGERPVGVMVQVTETAQFHEQVVAMNEALLLGSIRQHELAGAAESGNARLRAEITAHEHTARALVEKARLLDLSHDAIIVRDLDDKITLWNQGAEETYGWTSEEVIGEDLHALLQTEFPKPKEEIIAQLHREGRFDGEVAQVARDGRRVPSLCRWVLDRGTDSILTSYTDITERRRLEDALVARAEELARADRSKDEFLAMLAHELRNPLAPLRNAAEILRTADAGADACEQAQRILARQIENMTRMVDDLLDVSRITQGKIGLQRQVVALASVLTAAANLARPGLAARGQEFTMTLPPGPVYLHADATRLEQVLGNLLNNASKYSDIGGHITLGAERVEAPPGQEAPEIIVRVRDDGTGIAPELLPHVFDLFVQATRASDRAHGGLGIGLTLVQRLVTMHGGRVEARSDGLGHGSEFIVRLPILPGPAAAPLSSSAPPARETPRRMLIVDDNEDSARTMSILQRLRGHETRTAFTGPDAVTAVAEFTPEVVLLDIGLPGMDGFEVARRLRALPALAGMFLVAMTGYDSQEDRDHAREAGFDEYLVKPVDLDLLRTWLRARA